MKGSKPFVIFKIKPMINSLKVYVYLYYFFFFLTNAFFLKDT